MSEPHAWQEHYSKLLSSTDPELQLLAAYHLFQAELPRMINDLANGDEASLLSRVQLLLNVRPRLACRVDTPILDGVGPTPPAGNAAAAPPVGMLDQAFEELMKRKPSERSSDFQKWMANCAVLTAMLEPGWNARQIAKRLGVKEWKLSRCKAWQEHKATAASAIL